MFHPGYWGRHVGYYGGVNYGFGYMGVGFVGGLWHGHDFVYNTAVVHVNRTVIRNTYIDRTIVERNTIVNDRHVAYSGGPGGIRHEANRDERSAMNERHDAPTRMQEEHFQAARDDRGSYVKNNGGHPEHFAVDRPTGGGPAEFNHGQGNARPNFEPRGNDSRPAAAPHNDHVMGNTPDAHGRPQFDPRPAPRNDHVMGNAPDAHGRPQFESRPTPAPQHQMEGRPGQERSNQQQRPEAHPAPQQHESHQSAPHDQGKPQHDHGNGKGR
jgi:hypothetical protein